MTDADRHLIGSVSRGNTVTFYFNGLGQVSPPVATGSAAPVSPPSLTTVKPQVTLGGVPCDVQYSQLWPGVVSVYELKITIPAGAPTGNQPLVVSQAGYTSPIYTIAVN